MSPENPPRNPSEHLDGGHEPQLGSTDPVHVTQRPEDQAAQEAVRTRLGGHTTGSQSHGGGHAAGGHHHDSPGTAAAKVGKGLWGALWSVIWDGMKRWKEMAGKGGGGGGHAKKDDHGGGGGHH